MADKKISQLTNATTPLAGTEVLPVVQGGNTVKVSVDNLTAGKTVKAATFDTDIAAAKVTLSGIALAAGGSDTNVNVEINPKGASGSVVAKTSNVFAQPVTTANVAYFRAVNAGGTAYLGLDSASAGLSTAHALNLWHSGNYPVVFGTNDIQRGRWDTSGNLKIENGNLQISTAAKGIDFSANTGNVLTQYKTASHTPTWTATSVNPALGNGTLIGSYVQIGSNCMFQFSLTMGSTTTFGTGEWEFTAPFTASKTGVGSVWALDSGTAYYIGAAKIEATSNKIYIWTNAGVTGWSATAPFTWAADDRIEVGISFTV
jgi:hypothetical protein